MSEVVCGLNGSNTVVSIQEELSVNTSPLLLVSRHLNAERHEGVIQNVILVARDIHSLPYESVCLPVYHATNLRHVALENVMKDRAKCKFHTEKNTAVSTSANVTFS